MLKLDNIFLSYQRISKFIINTPLHFSERLSNKFNANIYLKREDLQTTRSFKIRGALNKILLNQNDKNIVCASAGNHAQGVAFSSNLINKKAIIFLPNTTPLQKIKRIEHFGKNNIELKLEGKNFQETLDRALIYSEENNCQFIHPYNDLDIITGQSTIAYEIFKEIKPDYIISSIGGGGLISGIIAYNKINMTNCKIIGAEPENADSMTQAIINNNPIELKYIDTFVDGASVKKVGNLTYNFCKESLNDIKIIDNGKLCYDLLKMYQDEGIILEPAGCLSVSALDLLDKSEIEGKNIICILSGGNNDVSRYPEIIEKSLIYQNIKHYYIIEFTQKPKQLKKFITGVLGEKDDITRFEYIKKTNKSFGNVLIGIETLNNLAFENKLKEHNFNFVKIDENDLIYSYLI
jgi:threonine dehydratase